MEILQILEKEFYHLQSLCERKCEHASYMRRHCTQLRISVLRKFGFEETYSSVNSHPYDLESGEEDDWRTKDYLLHQVDSCIEVAIQRQKEQLCIELSKIDARIMRNVSGMQQLEVELEPASAHDYQSILVPLVKSFMRTRLEDLAEKDATQKSDAAREAFLAELALDSKKGIGGGTDTSRHLYEKSKEKKKNKDYRKTKEFKAIGSNELHMLHHETVENISLVVAFDGGHPDSGIVVTGSGLDLNQQEEELGQRKIELEAEERKLEETLEYQRRIENEAKQKHLAEQHKKTALAISEKKEAVGLPDDCFPHIDNDQNVFEQLKHSRQEDCFYDMPYNTGYQISMLRLQKIRDEIMKCTLSIYVDIYFD